jgi:hypothetical protein
MTLGIVINAPEGLVFATESRTAVDWTLPNGSKRWIHHDATYKLLTLNMPNNWIAAVHSGIGNIGDRSVHSFVPDIEAQLAGRRFSVEEFAKRLSTFFKKKWDETPQLKESAFSMEFLIGGFNKKDEHGRLYIVKIPHEPEPTKQGEMSFIGETDIAHRLMLGYSSAFPKLLSDSSFTNEQIARILKVAEPLKLIFPYGVMGLQGYVDLAMLLIRTTIDTTQLWAYKRMCGGPIDVATITRKDGLRYVQVKEIKAELRLSVSSS